MGAACRRLVEDLEARYGSSITNVSVSVLQSAAKLVISQGELLYPGREYAQIRRWSQYLDNAVLTVNTMFAATSRISTPASRAGAPCPWLLTTG